MNFGALWQRPAVKREIGEELHSQIDQLTAEDIAGPASVETSGGNIHIERREAQSADSH